MSEIDNDEIRGILYQISKEIILPKFKRLIPSDINKKDNGSLVTSVDVDVENKLKNYLLKLLPNSLFVGEETFSKYPKIIQNYDEKNFCWTVDPIDGTSNFVKGLDKFAIMIALTFKDQIIQSWIYKPVIEEFSYAILGGGTFINGEKFMNSIEVNISKPTGSLSSKYWDENYKRKISNLKNKIPIADSYKCIGFEYVDIVKNIRNFIILSKLLPWDHIPGTLLIKESGGHIKHFDNSPYNYTIEKNNLVVTNSINLLNKILNLIKE